MREAVKRREMSCFEVVTQAEMKLFIMQPSPGTFWRFWYMAHVSPAAREKSFKNTAGISIFFFRSNPMIAMFTTAQSISS